jgi:acetylornithine deacetylase
MNAPLRIELSAATLAMIRRLVAFDTTSRESNLELIDWVRGYLRDHGIDSRLTFDDERRKANLFATIGPQIDGGVVISGHTDVVPVDGQKWSSDPWNVVESGDRLVGRGVCDMKSFIAVALALVPQMTARTLQRPLHFALSYDEEVGCIGARRLISDLANLDYKPGGCIVGEPTGMELVVAHKGKRSYRCRVRGFECHSALTPKGVKAVEIAAELVTHLRRMALRFREHGRFDHDYDVPFTTVHVGTIKGGTALNIVPKDCEFVFEFRFLPFDDPVRLLAEIEAFAARFLPEMRAGGADTRHHVRRVVGAAGIRYRCLQRNRGARALLQPGHAIQQGVVRRGSIALPQRRHPDDTLRTRTHRAGAPAGRMGEPRAGCALRAIHAAAARPGVRACLNQPTARALGSALTPRRCASQQERSNDRATPWIPKPSRRGDIP